MNVWEKIGVQKHIQTAFHLSIGFIAYSFLRDELTQLRHCDWKPKLLFTQTGLGTLHACA